VVVSEQSEDTKKRRLPFIGKVLMPEVLPEPLQYNRSGDTPRQRVRKRLLQLGERAAVLAAAGSLGSCAGDKGGGYMVVDQLPVPATVGCPPQSTLSVTAVWRSPESFEFRAVSTQILVNVSLGVDQVRTNAKITVDALDPPSGSLARVLDASDWPDSITMRLSVTCRVSDQVLASYPLVVRFFTGQPLPGTNLAVVLLDSLEDLDGGR
jgi:hypothetical protein